MTSRDIRICDPPRTEANSEIRVCDPDKQPRSPMDIRLCEETAECSDPPEFAWEIDYENNRMRVTSGQAPLRRILATPCGTGQPGDEITVGQWVSLTCACSTRLQDACGRVTPATYGDPENAAPTLSGPDTMAVGSVYTVSDGDPTFGWSFSGGSPVFSISEDTRSVTITDLSGTCGGTITATDKCERQASKGYSVGSSLSLTGTDAPSVGSQYSASGGVAPYTWSISCGAISAIGQVTSLSGCCGSGEVSVTDACGTSASIEVRFPNGTWVQINYEDFRGVGCGDWSWSAGQITWPVCYVGRYRIRERHQRHGGADDNCFPNSCPPPLCPDGACRVCWERWTDEWRCS